MVLLSPKKGPGLGTRYGRAGHPWVLDAPSADRLLHCLTGIHERLALEVPILHVVL